MSRFGVAVLALVLLQFAQIASANNHTKINQPGYCAFVGNPHSDKPHNWNIPAFKPDGEFDVCQEFQEKACCVKSQVDTLNTQIQQAFPMFGSCTSCMSNFMKLWCTFTCSPDQSTFVDVLETSIDTAGNESVQRVAVHVDSAWSWDLFNSCKDVKFAATGQSVMELVFGSHNPQEWFNFLSDNSPFPLDFDQVRSGMPDVKAHTMYYDVRGCNETCSCNDCAGSCPVPEPAIPPYQCLVSFGTFDLQCRTVGLAGGFVFMVVLISVIACLVYRHHRRTLLAAAAQPPESEEQVLAAAASDRRAVLLEAFDDSKGSASYTSRFQRFFYNLGLWDAKHPLLTLLLCLLVAGGCGAGVYFITIETTPEKLWVDPSCQTELQKGFFNQHFGGFYRIEQVIIRPKEGYTAISKELLLEVLAMEKNISTLVATVNGHQVHLMDICNQPTASGCIIETPTEWWQQDETLLQEASQDDIHDHVIQCANNQVDPTCLSSIGAFTDPKVALGGFEGKNYTDAKVAVTTYLLNNFDSLTEDAEAWELLWLDVVRQPHKTFDVSYMAERSVADELAAESSMDVITVIMSYALMFVYVSVALGRVYKVPVAQFFVRSKFLLGLAGIIMVIFSVVAAAGICSLIGVHATLIISEVIPFLVLAIGVDNIFILVNKYEQATKSLPVPERVAHAVAQCSSSICLAATTETLAFLLGALTRMPAVQAFALYAGMAVLFDFLFQLTAFPAIMSLDGARVHAQRLDCLPCIKCTCGPNTDLEDPDEYVYQPIEDDALPTRAVIPKDGAAPAPSLGSTIIAHTIDAPDVDREQEQDPLLADPTKRGRRMRKPVGFIRAAISRFYTPLLLHPCTKTLVLIIFVGLLLFSANNIPTLERGLDQSIALPQGSYIVDYFEKEQSLLRVGPPAYFVVKGLDLSTRENQNLVCGLGKGEGGCLPDSLVNTVSIAGMSPEQNFFIGSTSSWLDEYLQWLLSGDCCRYHNQTVPSFCPPEDMSDDCVRCVPHEDMDAWGRPPPAMFQKYLDYFLHESKCTDACGVCGMPFMSDVELAPDNKTIISSRFRSYHTILQKQSDYINGLANAIALADQLNKAHPSLQVFPYSVFYIFFEQYLGVVQVALQNIGLALAAVLLMTSVMLRNLRSSLIITMVIVMIVVDMLGLMAIWGVSLNAVSVVNMSMGIGISVEFCVHIAHSFTSSKRGSRDHRVAVALTDVGASVMNGITVTKFIGVMVLAFSRSLIFVIYYFRIFFIVVVLGATHGFILLPVLLSLFGSPAPSQGRATTVEKGPSLAGSSTSPAYGTTSLNSDEPSVPVTTSSPPSQ
ncbi:putative Niemann-Pick type protein 1B [Paratrimastix pyriformis]|uniref:Niemann-Pick type protein 1B n=1 Tax=Paratrimastix pyriformis TaxID=342808 RepID=A0ABQ8UVJ2_9EUKA|nr:putative Niemann-Pick type protein 1B [Paratrimastix pyriformis]|eukprot:GAFH01000710.1.p1 GENE.GAFH01000710.1~~GAFH01000710.1.p1  ORF type:complete len:1318 (+),score=425.22 GAFH01000710.1:34-3987(+)